MSSSNQTGQAIQNTGQSLAVRSPDHETSCMATEKVHLCSEGGHHLVSFRGLLQSIAALRECSLGTGAVPGVRISR